MIDIKNYYKINEELGGRCIYCKTGWNNRSVPSLCCSFECFDKLHVEHGDTKQCEGCGKQIGNYPHRKYCNAKCRTESSPERIFIDEGLREQIFEKNDYRCIYCGNYAEHVDHFIPISKGGTNKLENLVPACASCNYTAGARVFISIEEKKEYLLEVRGVEEIVDYAEETNEYKREDFRRPAWHAWVYGSEPSPHVYRGVVVTARNKT